MNTTRPGLPLATERTARVASSRKLLRRAGRERAGAFLAEGPQAVREAVRFHGSAGSVDVRVREVYVDAALADRYAEIVAAADAAGIEVVEGTAKALASLSDSVTPQGLVARCELAEIPPAAVIDSARLLAVPVAIRDPGNLGTVIRCADAAGADGVVVLGESVDSLNPKTVRATAGSLFHLPVAREADAGACVREIQAAGIQVLATEGEAGIDLDDLIDDGVLAAPTAWLLGNEAHGLPDDIAALADHRVRIPIHGQAESLNLATAAAVCLYASARAHRR